MSEKLFLAILFQIFYQPIKLFDNSLGTWKQVCNLRIELYRKNRSIKAAKKLEI